MNHFLRALLLSAIFTGLRGLAIGQCNTIDPGARTITPTFSDPYLGPGDTVQPGSNGAGGPSGPITGGGNPPSGQPGSGPGVGPVTGGPTSPGPPVGSPSVRAPISGSAGGGAGEPEWRIWWEFHKLDYLVRRRIEGFEIDGDSASSVSSAAAQRLLRGRDVAREALEDDAALVRGAACILWGRIGAEETRAGLEPRLEDPSQAVRHAALLGLGLSGRRSEVPLLFNVARTARVGDARSEKISSLAQFFAIVGLGLGRAHGLPEEVDIAIEKLGLEGDMKESFVSDLGRSYYECIQATDGLRNVVLANIDSKNERLELRCRSAESLRHYDDEDVVGVLGDAVRGKSLELRRSSALVLGDIQNEKTLDVLIAAYEREAELLTRGYLLVSIGRNPSAEALDCVLHAAKHDGSGMRPWSTLALGVHARAADSESAREAVREAYENARGSDQRATALLSMGIGADRESLETLKAALERSKSEIEREIAALSMGMLGGDIARQSLRRRLTDETAPRVRAAITQGLGQIGNPDDATALVAALRKFSQPELRVIAATALGFHGSLVALDGLLDLAADEGAPDAARAAALEASGLLLEDGPTLLIGKLSRLTNPYVAPDWVGMLWTSAL